ncbi:MAG: carbohydrate transporter permease [Paenibacillaceae bacterium]|jgi:putative aldouronate transport system permease protein|nr:carbohydrate transporter permease [Paenibacillaceae bacterium]
MARKWLKKINLFEIGNMLLLSLSALTCILPLIHITAVSFSSSAAAEAGKVRLWPVEFSMDAYRFILEKPQFWRAMLVTVERVGLTIVLGMFLIILTAYPLSKESHRFKGRTIYAWFFFFTMLFGGGLIPTYMNIRQLGLLDSIWALVLPVALSVYNLVIMLNFFRQIPGELGEAAIIDGAGQWRILWQIFVPLSKPAIATLVLMTAVTSWNSWFDGILYMNNPKHYPLQSFLQTVIIGADLSSLMNLSLENMEAMSKLSQRTIITAQILVGVLPILSFYPFLQKYFVKGMMIGGVKG